MVITTVIFSQIALALDPNLTIRQLQHTAWGPKQGAPLGGTYRLAQTNDGYLWTAGPAGLYRFDGISFERVELPQDPRISSLDIFSIFAPRRGGLWIGFTFGGVAFLRDGNWQLYTVEDGVPPGSPYSFAETTDNTLWVITSRDLGRFDGTHWRAVGSEMGLPQLDHPGMFVDGQGNLWAGDAGSLFVLRGSEKQFRNQPVKTRRSGAISSITVDRGVSESPEGTVWLDVGEQIVPVAQNPSPVERRWSNDAVLVFDVDGTLWESTSNDLRRITHPQHPVMGTVIHVADLADNYTEADGLSGVPLKFLLDREGNVWVGTDNGLDRFSEPSLEAPLQSPDNRKALPEINMIGLAPSDDAGGLWVTNLSDSLQRYEDGKLSRPTLTQHISCLLRARDGTVWIGGRGTLWHEQKGRLKSLPAPPGPGGATQALAIGKSGDLWASIVGSGVFRLKNGVWTPYGGIAALPRGPAITIVRDRRDRLWFSYPGGTVAVLDSDQVRLYGAADGLKVGNVMANYPGRTDQWLGGALGLVRFDGERFHNVRSVPELPLGGITGIVETANGDLWLNGRTAIVHLAASELENSRIDPSYPVHGEALGAFDGLMGVAPTLRPLPTAIEGGDGKLWFSTSKGFYGIDPARRTHNHIPPRVLIRSLAVGDRTLDPTAGLELPVRTTAVRFEYIGLSLTAAQKVRYRYRLDGVDSDWHTLTASRQALYTNLRPGKYTFHVIAANNDGVWNDRGASLAFSIPPAFVQTGWFLALCVASGALAVWALVRLRVRQVAARVRGRLEARMAERERIARDLHDTLLQGIQGLIWRFQGATDRIPPDQPARQLMEQSLDRAEKLLKESRDRVKDLRPATREVGDLAQALAAEGEHFAQLHPAQFRVTVQGTCRDLHPIVREETTLISREALVNAFRHSGAKDIEAEVTYGEAALHVRVRDDGQGISASVLQAGDTPGHFGLIGMRERAAKIGGFLEIWSKPDVGTEVDLRVPAHVAYTRSQSGFPNLRSWRDIFRSTAQQSK